MKKLNELKTSRQTWHNVELYASKIEATERGFALMYDDERGSVYGIRNAEAVAAGNFGKWDRVAFVPCPEFLEEYEVKAVDDGTTCRAAQGLFLLRDWGNDYARNLAKAKLAAARLLGSLVIVHGTGSELLRGLAYTSSSDFAAVWNCNTEARKRGTMAYFHGIAITDNGAPVAVYTTRDYGGNEIGTRYEIID